jgi:hypothetical protein
MNRVRNSYFEAVAPERFGFVRSTLRDVFRPTRFPDYVVSAAGLHYLCSEASSFDNTGDRVFDPDEMLMRLKGDCQDQSVLLASMYLAAGLDVRFVRIDRPGGDRHVLPEVYCPVSDSQLTSDVLKEFYRREVGESIGDVGWEGDREGSGVWLVADPVFSRYVGDIRDLRRDGYIEVDGSGGWEWTDLVEVHER